MKKLYVFILALIIFIACFLRFYHLGQNPPSLTWDEAAWGYNAYSLGIDGRDEFGKFLPIDYLESFGDFKPPMYAYLDIIPIKIFGLTEFATRFPSALVGVLTVWLTYFLTKEIFWKSKNKGEYSLLAAGVLALSPWHIMLSRAAFEANVATFFMAGGVWLFLKGIHEKSWLLCGSIIFFVLSLYTFNSTRVIAPLMGIALVIVFRKQLFLMKKQFIIASIIGVLMIAPITKFLLSPQANLRFKEVNIFSDSSIVTTSNQEIANDHNALWSKIIHNRRFLYSLSFLRHYFDNLTPQFLFIKGDGNPKFSTQDVGQLYLWDLPFFIAGILFLFRKKEGEWFVIPLWLLLAIIPAATARETPHALRIEAALPTFQILIAYGVLQVFILIKNHSKPFVYRSSIFLSVILLGLQVAYFLHGYYVHYPREYSGEWQYGYKDSIRFVQSQQKNYQNIWITEALGRPYIYYLFYTKTDPRIFRKEAVIARDTFGFVDVTQFGKYHFAKTLPTESLEKSFYIGSSGDVSGKVKIIETFYLLNGKPTLVAYE